MTNKEIKLKVNIDKTCKVKTSDGDTFVGNVSGPYDGYPQAVSADYRKDKIHIYLSNRPDKMVSIPTNKVLSIDEL